MRLHTSVVLGFGLLYSLTAHSEDTQARLIDEWATEGYTARVQIAPCENADTVCGRIVWLWNPFDESGAPQLDAHNPKPELRGESLIGLSILRGFRPDLKSKTPRLIGGTIYDPESGRTYRATLEQRSDTLEVEGCVLFVCRKQIWRRAASLCPPPTQR